MSSTAGGSLILDNGASTATIDFTGTSTSGVTIGAPIILNSNLEISMAQVATHTLSGIISGARSIAIDTNGSNTGQTINGQGDLVLRGMNTYTGGTTITEARVQAHGFSFGTGVVTVNNFGGIILNQGGYVKNNLNLTGLGWKETTGSLGALRADTNSVFTGAITPVSVAGATVARINSHVASTSLFNGTFAGSGDLEFSTSAAVTGTFILNNTVAQTHSGNYIVDRALSTGTMVLQIGNNNTSGSILGANNVTVSTGGVLQFNRTDNVTFANPILVGAGSGGVTQAGLGTVTLTNAALGYTGTTAVNSLNRKLIIGTGGAVAVGTTAAVLSNYGDAEFITSSAIALSGTSTGSRDTYITQGGTGIGAGAQLNLNSTADITLPWVTGASTGNTRLIQSGTGTLTLGGSNNLLAESDNSSLGLQVNSGTVVFDKRGSTGFQAGSAFGPGNTGGIGGRALGSSGNNAGDGLIINGGTVRYASTAHADQLFDNVDVRVNGGVLDFNGISDTFDSLLGTGGKLTNGAVGTTSIIGIGAAGSFQAMQFRALANYGGVIEDGLGQIELIKTGTGTQVLSGLNTYTGKTTVLQGFLQIDSETRLGVAAVPMLNQLVFSGANNISGGGLETLVDVTIDDVNRGVWLNRGGGNGDSNAMRPAAGTTLTFATPIAGDGGIQNVGLGTLKLSGANLYHGSTGTFSGGTIALDYTTQNNSKIADAGSLILRGGILNLIGGSHVEVSGSTTIDGGGVNAGASYITRTGGSSTLNLNAITRTNATAGVLNIVGTTVDVSIDGLTTTDSNNINSILVSGAQAGGLTVSQGGLVVTGDAFSNANQINDAPASATVYGAPISLGDASTGANNILFLSGKTAIGVIRRDLIVNNLGTGTVVIGGGNNTATVPVVTQTYAGTTTLNRATTIRGDGQTAGNTIFLGPIAGTVGTLTIDAPNVAAVVPFTTLNTATAGVVQLQNDNTFTGDILVSGAILSVGTGILADVRNQIPDASNVTLTGVSAAKQSGLVLSGDGETINNLNGDANSFIQSGNTASSTTLTRLVVNGVGTFLGLYNGGNNTGMTLEKAGSGTFTLGGIADNATGRAIVSSGILQFAKTSSSSIHAVAGDLIIKGTGTLQLAGTGGDQIYDQINVTMFNTGTLDLNGTNEGIQSLFGDTGTVTNNHATTASTLTLGTNNGSSLFGGTIVNGLSTLALTKANAGGAVLTGVNTYTGATTITGGFVQLGNGGITGGIAAASNVVTGANTQLVFNRMDSFPIANAISGAGAVVQNGMSGTVSLTGATTTYTGGTIINSATLSAGNGGTAGTFGAGNITVAAGANAQSNRSNNWTLANPIGGQGNFIQAGTGVTTATALNTYTGTTTVNAGTLEVGGTGALTGTTQVTINTGGTLLLTSTAADRVNDAAPVTLAGGTLNTGGLNETMGALTMTGNSIIDFGAGTSLLTSASAAGSSWTGTLSIWNWTGIPVTGGGTDQLLLTSAAANGNITFSNINFFSGAGTGQIGFGSAFVPNGFGGGEIVPVPEPSSVATVMGLLGLIGWRERRKAAHARQAARSAK